MLPGAGDQVEVPAPGAGQAVPAGNRSDVEDARCAAHRLVHRQGAGTQAPTSAHVAALPAGQWEAGYILTDSLALTTHSLTHSLTPPLTICIGLLRPRTPRTLTIQRTFRS